MVRAFVPQGRVHDNINTNSNFPPQGADHAVPPLVSFNLIDDLGNDFVDDLGNKIVVAEDP